MQLTSRRIPWSCNGCRDEFKAGTTSRSCQLCRWDACESCAEYVCPHGHLLERATREAFGCDKCFKNSVGDSVRCQKCDYTVCSSCRFETTARSVSRDQLDRIKHLCYSYNTCTADWSSLRAAVAAEEICVDLPQPLNGFVRNATQVCRLAESAVTIRIESSRLADRVARINLTLIEAMCAAMCLDDEDGGAQVRRCSATLESAFCEAATLLADFQRTGTLDDMNVLLDRTVSRFEHVHAVLTDVVAAAARLFSLPHLQRCAAPSTEDIRLTVLKEMVHVVEETRWLKQETEGNEDMFAAQATIQKILASEPFRDLLPLQNVDPRAVVVDKDTMLGRGSFATVYAGTLYGQTKIAVKVVKMVYEDALPKVEDEVRRANRSRHRNVVHVYGTVPLSEGGEAMVGIVMERLGQSLEMANVSDARLRMKYTLDIIAGMEHIHGADRSVAHFDLKPGSILLTQDGRSVKIIAFSVSQTATTLASSVPTVCGTLPFMAPELFTDNPQVSAACDVYSFAVVVAELWTGSIAWDGTPPQLVPGLVAAGRRPFALAQLQGVPEPIIELIVACWAQNPRDRPTFTQLGELRKITDTMPIEWHTVTTVDEAQALSLAERSTLHVSSSAERTTLAVLAAIGADVRYLRLDALCNAAVAHGVQLCSSLLSLRLDNATDDGIRGLEQIPTLEELEFSYCQRLTDVSCLADCPALKKLTLACVGVTDAGIRGLERIPKLEELTFTNCSQITNVSCLATCPALKKLVLSAVGVTNAGIRGLERIPTLEEVQFNDCSQITDVSCLGTCPALKKLVLSTVGVTDAGIRGLEHIPTLEIRNRRRSDEDVEYGPTGKAPGGHQEEDVEYDWRTHGPTGKAFGGEDVERKDKPTRKAPGGHQDEDMEHDRKTHGPTGKAFGGEDVERKDKPPGKAFGGEDVERKDKPTRKAPGGHQDEDMEHDRKTHGPTGKAFGGEDVERSDKPTKHGTVEEASGDL
jgi:hypothetical protein